MLHQRDEYLRSQLYGLRYLLCSKIRGEERKSMLFCVVRCILPPWIFEQKRDCSQSKLTLHDFLEPLMNNQMWKYPSFFEFSSIIQLQWVLLS